MNKTLIASLIVSILMVGCGSDDSDESASVTPPEPEVIHKNMTIDVEPNDQLEGDMHVFFGKWYPCNDENPDFCDKDGKNKFVRDELKHHMLVSAKELKQVMGESINSDIMADGQYTILDLVLYASQVRDDFKVTLGEFDETIGTYRFTTSFDFNEDGKFDESDGLENFNSPDWYTRFTYTSGDFKREIGEPSLEAIYERLDEFVLRDNTEIRLEAFSPEMTERREQIQAAEVTRKNTDGGKVIVPSIEVDFGDGRGYVEIAKNVEVKPYNLRPDIFKKDVLTVADAVMSAYYDQGLDIEFTYWPTLSTGSNVDAFAVTNIQGQRASGLFGWLLYTGENMSSSDFFLGKVTPEDVINNRDKYCTWIDDITDEQAKSCIADFKYQFGGNMLHLMPDTWVLEHTQENIRFKWANHYALWQVEEFKEDDGKFSVYDIEKAVAPLDETHFGWNVADCSQCHSIDNIHLDGDSPTLPDTAEPYFCASCHGSNGAPLGHGEESRCNWCHSEDLLMVNHGGASKISLASTVECGEGFEGLSGPCANLNTDANRKPHDKAGNNSVYDENLKVTGNSDYIQDEQFPDPYSCVTCHPNK